MEDIIAHARELGKKIAAHPRCSQFMAAARAVAGNQEAQETLRAYQEQVVKVRTLEAEGKPIEVEDKHRLTECESKVAADELLKGMMKHQADYVELMNSINHAIDEAVQAGESGAAEG
jgi:cell fate (sporulation/competence/biofilm development) regulator YlbF (YheA/YmcA/DUF963 family)